MKKGLVVLSGGQDSMTCLAWAIQKYDEVEAIIFEYGQKQQVEVKQAEMVCKHVGIKHLIVDLYFFQQVSESALTKHEQSVNDTRPDGLPSTFTPNRNALFLTVAHAYAQQIGAMYLVTGVCQTDYSGYPDCRREFIGTLEHALNLGSGKAIQIETPLMWLTKAQTFKLAEELGFLKTVLEYSHTCYNGNRERRHEWGYGCGTCPACLLRSKGWDEYQEKYVAKVGV